MVTVDSFITAQEWFEQHVEHLTAALTRLENNAAEFGGATAAETARAYVAIKNTHEAVEQFYKRLGELKNNMQHVQVPEAFEREGIKTFTANDGFRVTITQTVRASIKDKEAGFEWLRENELGDLIQPTVNSQTLAATARSLLEEGKELPDELFNVHLVANTSVTKVKK